MMLSVRDLLNAVTKKPVELEVRIGDVAEGSDLHCSVEVAELRGGCLVLTPGGDDVWKDETVASEMLAEQLWPEEEREDASIPGT